jgi:putative oxidoreductase
MSVVRAAARPMMASIFVIQGYDTLRHPDKYAPQAESVVQPLSKRISAVPEQTEQAVRVNGAVQLVAGSLLAMGRLPRLSALALAATLVPTTVAGHQFWATDDKQEQAEQRIHFLKNAAMLGGLLIAAADTGGDPSLAWRGRHAVRSARRDASLTAKTAKVSSRAGAKAGVKVGRASARADRLTGKKGHLTNKVGQLADLASERGAHLADRAGERGGQFADRAGDLSSQLADRASDLGGQLADRAGDLGGRLADRAGDLGGQLAVRAGDLGSQLTDKAGQLTDRLPASG